jgi:hypothetical protein
MSDEARQQASWWDPGPGWPWHHYRTPGVE